MKNLLTCIVAGVVSTVLAVEDNKSKDVCYALALSGGGSKGSYEAGVLWGLYYNAKDKTKYQYDVVTGVSAGAINTGAITMFAPGDEENMLQFLSDAWQHISNDQVFKQWYPLGPVTGINSKSGILDNSPLFDYLTKTLGQYDLDFKRKLTFSCVDASSGNYITFHEDTKQPVKAIVSSASIPFVFPSQIWPDEGYVCMDGASAWNTNLVSAIKRCREEVDDDSKIVLDIINCDSSTLDKIDNTTNTYSNYYRFKDIKNYANNLNDIHEFQRAYPKVNFRHYIQPSKALKGNGPNMINFDNSTCTYSMQMQGREDGAMAANQADGFYQEKFQAWRANQDGVQDKFSGLDTFI